MTENPTGATPETPDDEEAEALFADLKERHLQLVRAVARVRTASIAETTLTMQQLKIVGLLAHRQPIGGQELSRDLGVSLATISGIVDRLVDKGLVQRAEDPRDRRVRLISLTEQGQELAMTTLASEYAFTMSLLARMSPSERRQLSGTLDIILRIVQEEAAHLDAEPGSAEPGSVAPAGDRAEPED